VSSTLPSAPRHAATIGLLVCTAVLLAFPDIVPASARTIVTTFLTLAAMGTGIWLLAPWNSIRTSLWIFAASVATSWACQPDHPLVSLSHFSGIGLGVLIAGTVGRVATTEDRIFRLTSVLVVGAIGVLMIGLIGTASSFNNIKFIRWNQMLTISMVERLETVALPLPGLEGDRRVNANALGGTAVMVLPLGLGLFVAGRHVRYRRWPTLLGLLSTVLATLVLCVTLSRSAWLAFLICVVVVGLRWPRRRGTMAVIVIAAVAIGAAGVVEWRAASPAVFDRLLQDSLEARLVTWRFAIEQVWATPWVGIGVNRFHSAGVDGTYVAHAHNIVLQILLDVGVIGTAGYVLLMGRLGVLADRVSRQGSVIGPIGAAAGLSLLASHAFGLVDAITLGAKVGAFQWASAGLILGASRLHALAPTTSDRPDFLHRLLTPALTKPSG